MKIPLFKSYKNDNLFLDNINGCSYYLCYGGRSNLIGNYLHRFEEDYSLIGVVPISRIDLDLLSESDLPIKDGMYNITELNVLEINKYLKEYKHAYQIAKKYLNLL